MASVRTLAEPTHPRHLPERHLWRRHPQQRRLVDVEQIQRAGIARDDDVTWETGGATRRDVFVVFDAHATVDTVQGARQVGTQIDRVHRHDAAVLARLRQRLPPLWIAQNVLPIMCTCTSVKRTFKINTTTITDTNYSHGLNTKISAINYLKKWNMLEE